MVAWLLKNVVPPFLGTSTMMFTLGLPHQGDPSHHQGWPFSSCCCSRQNRFRGSDLRTLLQQPHCSGGGRSTFGAAACLWHLGRRLLCPAGASMWIPWVCNWKIESGFSEELWVWTWHSFAFMWRLHETSTDLKFGMGMLRTTKSQYIQYLWARNSWSPECIIFHTYQVRVSFYVRVAFFFSSCYTVLTKSVSRPGTTNILYDTAQYMSESLRIQHIICHMECPNACQSKCLKKSLECMLE